MPENSDEALGASVTSGALRFVSQLLQRVQSGIQAIVVSVCDQITAAMQSAGRSEVSNFRFFFRQEGEKFRDLVRAEKQELADSRREFEARIAAQNKSQCVAELYNWCAKLSSGKYICVACSTYMHLCRGKGISMKKVPWLMQNGGVTYTSRQRFQTTAWKHENDSSTHALCIEMLHDSSALPLESALEVQGEHAMIVTENLMKVTLSNALKYRAFLDYESLVTLVSECGGDVGDWLHSRETSKAMAGTLKTHF